MDAFEKKVKGWKEVNSVFIAYAGGASSAAAAGISDRLFKKHGRWRSEKAKDGYVRETIQEKLHVTKNLGI